MREQKLADAYRSWRQALENMRMALTMNPLLTEPLRASADVFETVGRMLFGSASGPVRRAARASGPRKARARAAAAMARSKVKARPRRRRRSSKKS